MTPTEQMTRPDLLEELRGYAHPLWYQLVLGYTTPMLAALVAYYRH